ncbi:MAG: hypothetical protein SOW46_03085 [Candidatus Aphodomonas sp.]|nr:hypothetical protein [Candidatus Aphodomonas sp.]
MLCTSTLPYDSANDLSLVMRIVYGDTSFLFTGDAERDAEHEMVEAGMELSSTLLSVGHHGSNTSSSYVFLREVMPEYAVISVGKDNAYGHPSEDTLSRLRDVGALVYRTDLQGTITCVSDEHSLSFETEKNVTADGLDRAMLIASAGSLSTFNRGKTEYVLNTRSKKIHLPDCASVDKMKEKNKAYSSETIEELESQGYTPCGNCRPDLQKG